MNKELVKKYTEIKSQIKTLTEEAKVIEKEITPSVIEVIENSEFDNIQTDFGKLFKRVSKSITYSKLVSDVEEIVKNKVEKIEYMYKHELGEIAEVKKNGGLKIEEAKEKDIEAGTAEVVEKKSLTFRGK